MLLSGSYTRDLGGRILTIDEPGTVGDWTYVYNSFDRLVSANNIGTPGLSEVFSYQPNGNLVTRTRLPGGFVYPAANGNRPHAPLSQNGVAIGYDANGNMTSDAKRVS